jgi:hypothetical protein
MADDKDDKPGYQGFAPVPEVRERPGNEVEHCKRNHKKSEGKGHHDHISSEFQRQPVQHGKNRVAAERSQKDEERQKKNLLVHREGVSIDLGLG